MRKGVIRDRLQSTTREKVLVLEDARETKIIGSVERKFDFWLNFNGFNQLNHSFGSCLPIFGMVFYRVYGFIAKRILWILLTL